MVWRLRAWKTNTSIGSCRLQSPETPPSPNAGPDTASPGHIAWGSASRFSRLIFFNASLLEIFRVFFISFWDFFLLSLSSFILGICLSAARSLSLGSRGMRPPFAYRTVRGGRAEGKGVRSDARSVAGHNPQPLGAYSSAGLFQEGEEGGVFSPGRLGCLEPPYPPSHRCFTS